MADDTPDTSEKKSIVAPMLATATGLYAGGLGASYAFVPGREKLRETIDANASAIEKSNAAYARKLLARPEHKGLKTAYKAHQAALSAHAETMDKYYNAAGQSWGKEIGKLDAATQGNVIMAGLKGEIEYLKQGPASADRRTAIEIGEEQLRLISEAVAKPEFTNLLPDKAARKVQKIWNNAVTTAVENNEAKTGEFPQGAMDILHPTAESMKASIDAMIVAEPDTAQMVILATKKESEALAAAATKLEAAKDALAPLEKLIAENPAVKAAEKTVKQLMATESITSEKGFVAALKRPFLLAKEGGGKIRLAIIATAVALGSIGLFATRGSHKKQEETSFVKQQELRDAARDTMQGKTPG
jgi:hypothetical protein